MAFTRKENHVPPLVYDVPSFDTDLVEVPVPGQPGNSTRIFHRAQVVAGQARLRISFTQAGWFPAGNGFNPLCHYHVQAFIEGMGATPEINLPPVQINVTQGLPLVTYDWNSNPNLEITLPPVLQAGMAPGQTRIFRILTAIFFVLPGHSNNLLHGFDDSIGMFQITEGPTLP